MGANDSTMMPIYTPMDPESETASESSIWVFRTARGEMLDPFELALRWYGQLPKRHNDILTAVDDAITHTAPVFGVSVLDRGTAHLTLKRDSETVRFDMNDRLDEWTSERLVWMERIGQYVLAGAVTGMGPGRSADEYLVWSMGFRPRKKGGVAPPPVKPLPEDHPVDRMMRLFLACYTRTYGPSGFFWVLPLWYIILGQTSAGSVVERRVSCATDNAVPFQPLCQNLPTGCQVRHYSWPRRTWEVTEPLVEYLWSQVCTEMTGKVGTDERMHGRRQTGSFLLDSMQDDLHLFTVAGVPWIVAAIHPIFVRPDDRRLLPADELWALCGSTHTGATNLLFPWLQREVEAGGRAGIVLCCHPKVFRKHYRSHGFQVMEGHSDRWYAWYNRAMCETFTLPDNRKRRRGASADDSVSIDSE